MFTNKSIDRWFCVLLCLVAFAPQPARAQSTENQVKAVFLFNFAQFVTWPPEAFTDTNTPFVVGVLGEDPFGKTLDETVAGERVRDHKMVVQRYRNVQEITNCHILYISESETPRLKSTLESLAGRSVLTVGENDSFTEHGGMIRFRIVEKKVRLEINAKAAKAAKLTISSKLLRQSRVTETKPGLSWQAHARP